MLASPDCGGIFICAERADGGRDLVAFVPGCDSSAAADADLIIAAVNGSEAVVPGWLCPEDAPPNAKNLLISVVQTCHCDYGFTCVLQGEREAGEWLTDSVPHRFEILGWQYAPEPMPFVQGERAANVVPFNKRRGPHG